MVSSRVVADRFEKRHDHILRDIENLKKDVPNFGEMFKQTIGADSYGREQKQYELTRVLFSKLFALNFIIISQNKRRYRIKYSAA